MWHVSHFGSFQEFTLTMAQTMAGTVMMANDGDNSNGNDGNDSDNGK